MSWAAQALEAAAWHWLGGHLETHLCSISCLNLADCPRCALQASQSASSSLWPSRRALQGSKASHPWMPARSALPQTQLSVAGASLTCRCLAWPSACTVVPALPFAVQADQLAGTGPHSAESRHRLGLIICGILAPATSCIPGHASLAFLGMPRLRQCRLAGSGSDPGNKSGPGSGHLGRQLLPALALLHGWACLACGSAACRHQVSPGLCCWAGGSAARQECFADRKGGLLRGSAVARVLWC